MEITGQSMSSSIPYSSKSTFGKIKTPIKLVSNEINMATEQDVLTPIKFTITIYNPDRLTPIKLMWLKAVWKGKLEIIVSN